MLKDQEYIEKLAEFQKLSGFVKSPPLPKMIIDASRWQPDIMPDPYKRDEQGGSIDIQKIEHNYKRHRVPIIENQSFIGRSFNLNAININASCYLSRQCADASWGLGSMSMKNLAGTVFSGSRYTANCETAIEQTTYGNDANKGIHIGSDATATAVTDYVCITKISHGDTSGKLRYWDMFTVPHSYDSGTKVWTKEYVRYFTNHSGGSVTIREMALIAYCRSSNGTVPTLQDWLIARDVLASAMTVNDGDIVRLSYSFTFPAFPA